MFSEIVDSLSSGATPWGTKLDGVLPPSDEMYAEFIGRPSELDELSGWLASDSPQILVWGYGGVGKSALAHKFAREVRDGSSEGLLAVCWVTAKQTEYVEGAPRERQADFIDLDSLVKAVWTATYGPHAVPDDLTPSHLTEELQDLPILLVVDDFDTVSEDVSLTEFLLYELRGTKARVVYTSRHRAPGIRNIEVPPFSRGELQDFVLQRSTDYDVDESACIRRLDAIRSVTGGYPLFVDDLIHHAAFVGIDEALKHWSQRKGDAARQYALQRQIQYLSSSSGDVLIALSVANRALRIVEISGIAGLTDDDAEASIQDLLRWRMVNKVKDDDIKSPVFRMNNNTTRLVHQTFRDDGRIRTFAAAFKALTGERVPEVKKAAIAKVIGRASRLRHAESFQAAEEFLMDNMTGELSDSPDLFSFLGWLYANHEPLSEISTKAEDAFQTAHRLGSFKVDTYYHWVELRKKIVKSVIDETEDGTIRAYEAIADRWKACEEVATLGLDRCGPSRTLLYSAGYAASRDANASMRANKFSYAQGAYTRSIDWYERALTAPVSDMEAIDMGMIYRGMTVAYDGLEDLGGLRNTLKLWHASSGTSDRNFESECRRLMRKYPSLRNRPELQLMLSPVPF